MSEKSEDQSSVVLVQSNGGEIQADHDEKVDIFIDGDSTARNQTLYAELLVYTPRNKSSGSRTKFSPITNRSLGTSAPLSADEGHHRTNRMFVVETGSISARSRDGHSSVVHHPGNQVTSVDENTLLSSSSSSPASHPNTKTPRSKPSNKKYRQAKQPLNDTTGPDILQHCIYGRKLLEVNGYKSKSTGDLQMMTNSSTPRKPVTAQNGRTQPSSVFSPIVNLATRSSLNGTQQALSMRQSTVDESSYSKRAQLTVRDLSLPEGHQSMSKPKQRPQTMHSKLRMSASSQRLTRLTKSVNRGHEHNGITMWLDSNNNKESFLEEQSISDFVQFGQNQQV